MDHGPFDISLKDMDDIALGLTSSMSYFNPEAVCFKDKECCFEHWKSNAALKDSQWTRFIVNRANNEVDKD